MSSAEHAAFKVTAEDGAACHGGKGVWKPGVWRSVKGDLQACQHGVHYCRHDQLVGWLGPVIWRFEDGTPNETIDAGDKMVTRKGRVVDRLETWNERTARLFAADCAETALVYIPEARRDPFVAAIAAARAFARGEISDQERAAAWAAAGAAAGAAAAAAPAGAAARAAAWAAAEDAAWAAAWDAAAGAAARDAAWAAAAGATARNAAWAAARNAAWDAARAAQTVVLFDYLEGRRA